MSAVGSLSSALRTFPCLDLTRLDLTQLDRHSIEERVQHVAREALYVGVGFSILAIQRAQVRRRELFHGQPK